MLIITRQVFFELFMILLLWTVDGRKNGLDYSTVDHVAKILQGYNILTEKQRKLLFKDRRLQSLFLSNAVILPQYSNYKKEIDYNDRAKSLTSKGLIEIRIRNYSSDINRERLLRDYHIAITPKGKEYAILLLDKYKNIITRPEFLDIKETLFEKPGSPAMAAIMKRYKRKVIKETKDKYN